MKYSVNFFAIVVVTFLVYQIIRFARNPDNPFAARTSRVVDAARERAGVVRDNIAMEMRVGEDPELMDHRIKRGSNRILIESRLLDSFPEIFGNFGPSDWQEFWRIIDEPIREGDSLFEAKRFRDSREIEAYLVENYSGFSRLSRRHWDFFWSIILES